VKLLKKTILIRKLEALIRRLPASHPKKEEIKKEFVKV
jgi:hypothetical protein